MLNSEANAAIYWQEMIVHLQTKGTETVHTTPIILRALRNPQENKSILPVQDFSSPLQKSVYFRKYFSTVLRDGHQLL